MTQPRDPITGRFMRHQPMYGMEESAATSSNRAAVDMSQLLSDEDRRAVTDRNAGREQVNVDQRNDQQRLFEEQRAGLQYDYIQNVGRDHERDKNLSGPNSRRSSSLLEYFDVLRQGRLKSRRAECAIFS